MYERNRIYINSEEQGKIKDFPILFAGLGVGSVIAECALRLGFENLTLVDGDIVERNNLNRQNYKQGDISYAKAKSLYNCLNSINPNAKIQFSNTYLNRSNIPSWVDGHQVVINALDFDTEAPLYLDEYCRQNQITVIPPYNLGWAGAVAVVDHQSLPLQSIIDKGGRFSEITMVEYIKGHLRYWGNPEIWLEEVLVAYINEKPRLSPPQLSIGSWLLGSMCTHILFNLATGLTVKKFPDFYFSKVIDDV